MKMVTFFSLSMRSEMRGSRYLFLMVIEFKYQ